MYGSSLRRDWHFGVYTKSLAQLVAVGINLYYGNFHDPIGCNVNSGGFKVEKYYRLVKLDPHRHKKQITFC
jgi:hypothetical protein